MGPSEPPMKPELFSRCTSVHPRTWPHKTLSEPYQRGLKSIWLHFGCFTAPSCHCSATQDNVHLVRHWQLCGISWQHTCCVPTMCTDTACQHQGDALPMRLASSQQPPAFPEAHLGEAADAAVAQVVVGAVGSHGQVGLLGGVQPAVDPGQRGIPRARQLLRCRQRPARPRGGAP